MPFDPSTAHADDVDKLVGAITHVESGGNTDATSVQGARGSMQIMPGTFKQYAQEGESYDDDDDRRAAATRKINDDYAYYNGDVAKTAAAYIGGRGAVSRDGTIRNANPDALGITPAAYAARVVSRMGAFDPATAKPVDATQFDPSTAQLADLGPDQNANEINKLQRQDTALAEANKPFREKMADTYQDAIDSFGASAKNIGAAAIAGIQWLDDHGMGQFETARPADFDPYKSHVDTAAVSDRLRRDAVENPGGKTFAGQAFGALPYVAAAVAGGPVVGATVMGGTAAYTTTQNLIDQNVDPDTAKTVGLIDGTAQALIGAIPFGNVAWGKGMGAVAATAVAAAVKAGAGGAVQSVATGAAISTVLAQNGYNALAKQYAPTMDKALDSATFMAAFHIGTQVAHRVMSGAPIPKPLAEAIPQSTWKSNRPVQDVTDVQQTQQLGYDKPVVDAGAAEPSVAPMQGETLEQTLARFEAAKNNTIDDAVSQEPAAQARPVMATDNVQDAITAATQEAAPPNKPLLLNPPTDLGRAQTDAIIDAHTAAQPVEPTPLAPVPLEHLSEHNDAIATAFDGARDAGTDSNGNTTYRGVPVVAVSAEALPAHSEAGTPYLSREQAAAYQELLGITGQRLTVFADHPSLPDAFVDPSNPDRVFMSDKTSRGSDVIVNHELPHLMKQSVPEAYKAYMDVIREEAKPGALDAAREQHGDHLTDDQLFEEIGSDIAGNASRNIPDFWSKVVDKLRARYGNEAARGMLGKVISALSTAADKVRALVKGGMFSAGETSRNIAGEYVNHLDRVHDAVADLYAAHYKASAKDALVPAVAQAAARANNLESLPTKSMNELRDIAANHERVYMQNEAAKLFADRDANMRQKLSVNAKTRLAVARRIDPNTDSMSSAIAKLGGIQRESAAMRMQFSPEELNSRGMIGNLSKPLFHKYGMTMDHMGAALSELGYVHMDENGKHDQADFEDKLGDVANGVEVHTPNAMMERAQAEHEHAQEEVGAVDEDDYHQYENEVDDGPQDAVDDLAHVEFGTPAEITDKELNELLQFASEKEISRFPDDAATGTPAGRAERDGPPVEGAGYELRGESQTEGETRLAEAQRQTQEAKTDEQRLAAAERRVEANKEIAARQGASADNFQLGQSAEDGLSGQQGLAMSAKRAEQTKAQLEEHDALFRIPISGKDTVTGIAGDIAPGATVRELTNIPGETRYNFEFPDGKTARLMVRPHNPYGESTYGYTMRDGDMHAVVGRPGRNVEHVYGKSDVWIDVSLVDAGEGDGGKMYAIAAEYAHNTGRVFIGDPNGISDEALQRRPEQMLSSALKFGTTDHLGPHPEQVTGKVSIGVAPLDWVYGDHDGNIRKLIAVNRANIENHGGDGGIAYNKESGTFEDSDGNPLTRNDLVGLAKAGLGRTAQAGGSTLARHALFESLVSGESGAALGSNGILDALSEQQRRADSARVDSPVAKILYSKKRGFFDPRRMRDDYEPFVGLTPDAPLKGESVGESISKALAPASQEGSQVTAGIIRENMATAVRERELAQERLLEFAKEFDRRPMAEVLNFIDNMERGVPIADPIFAKAAVALRNALDTRRDTIIALGKGQLENFNENYFPHIWKDRTKASTFFSRRPLEGGKGFLKQRKHAFFSDGIAAGLEPITTNPVELVMLKAREMDRYIYAQKIFNEMKDQGIAKFVAFGSKSPDGWTEINDKIARVMQFSDLEKAMIVRGSYYAPDAAARIINNHLSPGLSGIGAIDMVRRAGNIMNSVQLGLSAFHLGFTTFDAMISKGALGLQQVSHGDFAKGIAGIAQGLTPIQALINVRNGDKMLKAYLGQINDPEMAPIIDALLAGGGRVRMDSIYKNAGVNEFKQALRNGTYGKALVKAAPYLMDKINYPIFEWLVPRQKLGVFFDAARNALEMEPSMSVERKREVMGKIWDSVDNRMGELVYDNLFWNRGLKDALAIATRSPGWNLGTYREIGGGVIDLAKIVTHGETGNLVEKTIDGKSVHVPETGFKYNGLTNRSGYIFALAFYTAVFGALAQYAMTGETPKSVKDLYAPRTGRKRPDGSDDRITPPSYMKDVVGYANDIRNTAKYGENPFATVIGKIHPLLSLLGQLINNRDYFGGVIQSPYDDWDVRSLDFAKHAAKSMRPFSITNYVHQMAMDKKEPTVLGYMSSPSFFGVTPAPSHVVKSDAMNESAMVNKLHDGVKTKLWEQMRESNDPEKDFNAIRDKAIKSGMTPQEVQYIRSAAYPHPPKKIKSFVK